LPQVPLHVNKITSSKTQMPYRYYSLPVCRPDSIEEVPENIGEILTGDRIENSLYQVRFAVATTASGPWCGSQLSFKENKPCTMLCRKVWSEEDAQLMQSRIADDYRVNW
jgi:transmembrane 9 superfamily member 2/4